MHGAADPVSGSGSGRSSGRRSSRRRRRASRRLLLSATLVIAGLLGGAGLAWLGYSIMVDRAKGRYEEALTRFQAGDYRTAAVILDGIRDCHCDDSSSRWCPLDPAGAPVEYGGNEGKPAWADRTER